MKSKCENLDYVDGSFLHLMITIKDKKMCTKLFDKRNSFQILVVRMPYRDSNIPSKICYTAFGAKILGSVRTTIDATIFSRNSKILINHMMKQGGKIK